MLWNGEPAFDLLHPSWQAKRRVERRQAILARYVEESLRVANQAIFERGAREPGVQQGLSSAMPIESLIELNFLHVSMGPVVGPTLRALNGWRACPVQVQHVAVPLHIHMPSLLKG